MDNYNNFLQPQNLESWQSIAEPVVKASDVPTTINVDTSECSSENTEQKRRWRFTAPVLTFQLVICMLVLIFSYVANVFLSDLFSVIKCAYDKEISASMYFSGDFSDLNYSEFFGATNDEV